MEANKANRKIANEEKIEKLEERKTRLQQEIEEITIKMNNMKEEWNRMEERRQELKKDINTINIWKTSIQMAIRSEAENNNSEEEDNNSEGENNSSEEDSEPETVITVQFQKHEPNDNDKESSSDDDFYSIIDEEQINFNHQPYTYENERRVFLGKLAWRVTRRAIMESRTEERQEIEKQWKEEREKNQKLVEEFIKNQKSKMENNTKK
ncbi:serine/threonine-protein kinase rio2-like [Leptopilina heterotoma]|uniref:serine/threonine-protein kinase rio2-like n=1 Tax=Leptopilina heterotoma TaxID=63436 RepID=UPI001CA93E18|nr:serine/threonine-protein kinase rio2-like [Leptopilina heterotoma]